MPDPGSATSNSAANPASWITPEMVENVRASVPDMETRHQFCWTCHRWIRLDLMPEHTCEH
jgi:hypothetical protein